MTNIYYQGWTGDLSLGRIAANSDYFSLKSSITACLSVLALKTNQTLDLYEITGLLLEEKLPEIEKFLKEKGFIRTQTLNYGEDSKNLVFKLDDHTFIYIRYYKDSPESELGIASFKESMVMELKEKCQTFFDSEGQSSKNGEVYVLTSSQKGIQITELGIAGLPLERGNYSDSVLKLIDHVIEDLNSKSPCGSLTVLDGPPGCGKSFVIRSVINSCPNGLFVLIPPDMVAGLQGPQLMTTLLKNLRVNNRPLILIIEDADSVLAPRASDNMHSISSLLNLGSGIVGSLIDVRVVCTTNATRGEIDKAVLRAGRLCKHIHVPLLDFDQALEVFNRLTKKENTEINGKTTGSMSLADIYKAARDHGWKPEEIKGEKTKGTVGKYIKGTVGFDIE